MIMWLVVLGSAIFVYVDAKNIGVHRDLIPGFFNMGPGGWCAVTLLFWIIGFPAYLIKRGELVEAADREQRSRQMVQSTPTVPAPSDVLDDLERIANLRDRGVLSEAEFEAKKQEIMTPPPRPI